MGTFQHEKSVMRGHELVYDVETLTISRDVNQIFNRFMGIIISQVGLEESIITDF